MESNNLDSAWAQKLKIICNITIAVYIVVIGAYFLWGSYKFNIFPAIFNKAGLDLSLIASLGLVLFVAGKYNTRLYNYLKTHDKFGKTYFATTGLITVLSIASLLKRLITGNPEEPFTLFISVEDLKKPIAILAGISIIRGIIYILPEGFKVGSIFHLARSVASHPRAISRSLFALTLLIGISLRVWGLGQGIDQHVLHPDAGKQIHAIDMYLHGNYTFDLDYYGNRFISGYPYFSMHIAEWALRGIDKIYLAAGAGELEHNGKYMVYTARSLNVVYSVIIILLIYLLGMNISNGFAAGLSAYFVAVSIIGNQMTKYVGGDLPMSLFSLLAVYLVSLNLRSERNLWYILAGISIGISFACKYNGILTYIYVILLFLFLRKNIADVIRNIDKLIRSFVAGAIAYLITNADFWSDPVKTILAVKGAGTESANYKFPGSGNIFERIKYLYESIDHQEWVITGLFSPVPVWLALLTLLVLIYTKRTRYIYLWASPLIIFVIGKITMPISAPSHYLNIIPLFFLGISIGLGEIYKFIPSRKISNALILVLTGFMLYHSVQDNSMWQIKPLKTARDEWRIKNLATTTTTRRLIQVDFNCEDISGYDPVISRFYFDLPQAFSLHRNIPFCFYANKIKPLFYPDIYRISDSKKEIIYPNNIEFVSTDKVFITHNGHTVERYIKVSESTKNILIWMRNPSDSVKAEGSILVGDKEIKIILDPGEQQVKLFEKPSPTSLFYHQYYYVKASSKSAITWAIGSNNSDIGRLYSEVGKSSLAVKHFLRSGTPFSLAKVITLGDNKAKRKAMEIAGKKYGNLFTPEYFTNAKTSWEKATGYSDKIFASILHTDLNYKDFRDIHDGLSGWEIPPGGMIYGPYIPLYKGRYNLTIRWRESDRLESFDIDVVSAKGKKQLLKTSIQNNSLSKATFMFTVENLVEYPLEVRVSNVRGTSLFIDSIKLVPDYYGNLKKMLAETEQALLELKQ